MRQPLLSRVMSGLQAPTYLQVFIWLRVINAHYQSEQLARTCQELGLTVPVFSAEMERMLWNLASFLPPDELTRVYEQSKDVKPLGSYPSLVDHKEKRLQVKRGMNMIATLAGKESEHDATTA